MYIHQILTDGDEGTGNEIHIILDTKENVGHILLGQVGLLDHLSREAHAFAV